jgi:hypothetical protein
MLPSRTHLFAGVGLLLAALGADGGRDETDGGSSRGDARTVSGTISAVAWAEARVTIDAPGGLVTLKIDRNTAVFLENRLGSTRDLVVGAPVRASFGGDERAVWVEVRSLASASAAGRDGGLPDAGTGLGPPVLPPQPSSDGVPDAGPGDGGAAPSPVGDAGVPAPPPRDAPPGPPEPSPVRRPPRPPQPGPSGPGPLPGGANASAPTSQ